MNKKTISKILATLLVITLTFANIILLGVYTSVSYATNDNLEKQEITTNNEFVEFNAYFKDSKQGVVHSLKEDINAQNLKMYVYIKVKNGYLKDAKIQAFGEEETKTSNFKILNSNETLELIQNIDLDKNTINLKQINKDTEAILEIPIMQNKDNQFDLSNISKENRIKLNATYVDNAGKSIAIQKTIKLRLEWNGTLNVLVEQQIQRYIPYNVGDNKGVLLQTVVKTGLENNNLPIEETNINITVPTINGIKPVSVLVSANSTLATNGQNGFKFGEQNWNYNKETGLINIIVKNEAQNNIVSWQKNCKDEYVITYIYEEDVLIQVEQGIQTTQKIDVKIKAYNNVITEAANTITGKIELTEKLGEIVVADVKATTQDLSKGYLYTKSEKEAEYKIISSTDIGYAKLVDKLLINSEIDNFINEKEEASPTSISDINYAYYKSTTISKENFDKILGQDGNMQILSDDGTILKTFNKDTIANEQGNYVYNYEIETNKITIQTTKPIAEGKLIIEHIKSIKGNTDYSKKQLASFKELRLNTNTVAEVLNTTISSQDETSINLIEPTTKIEASINKQNLSTIVKNENVEIKVILKTNEINCDLYKNPVIEIVLPNYVEEVQIKNINLLFADELKIANYQTIRDAQGHIIIKVTLNGENTKYNTDEISKGANLVINSDITLKKLTPNKTELMQVFATNENVTTYENQVDGKTNTQVELKSVAPVGMVSTNTLTGYNPNNETVTSISGQEQIGKLLTNKETKTATVSMNIINNYNNVCKNVQILGRVPFENNSDIITKKLLGSNMTTPMKSKITTNVDESKVDIYYSVNGDATKDLSNVQNGWTTTPENLNTIKSYLIVLKDYEMKTGDILTATYNIEIPENISHNKSVYTTYVAYFDNVTQNQTIQDKIVATKVGLTTGEGPELEVSIKSDIQNGAEVEEGKVIKYIISAKNVGKTDVKNVTLSGNVPAGTIYTKYEGVEGTQDGLNQIYDSNKKEYSEVIPNIAPGQIKEMQYLVETKTLIVSQQKNDEGVLEEVVENIEALAKATAKVEGYDSLFTSNEIKNKIVQGYLNVKMDTQPIDSTVPRRESDEVEYRVQITNVNGKEKNNIVITNKLPDGVTFKQATNSGVYDASTNTVTWKFDKIQGYYSTTIVLKVSINKLADNEAEKIITNRMNIKTADKEINTNEVSIKVQKPNISIKQTSDTKGEIPTGDMIYYNIVVSNTGTGMATQIKVTDYLPEELQYKGATYVIDGKTYESNIGNKEAVIEIPSLGAGKTLDITIKALVGKFSNSEVKKQITNTVKVSAKGISEITANQITHTIVSTGGNIDDPSIDKPIEGTYKITGTTWLDSNNDGKRDETESTLGSISVMLINAENGQIVKDIVTGKNKIQETNEFGQYTFANLQPGKYIVVFLYDTGSYGITIYKKDGINESKNSDAISMKITIDGKATNAAVSDTIEIKDTNIANIDMGLIVSPKFDLRLDKVITKVTVNDSKTTKTHEYKDSKLAKVDMNAKTINNTNVIIEYKIRVTNDGAVAGYAKKIVDYLPQGMEFNSELNPDWYSSENGNLYNSSLANTLLQLGDTKELTLLLTKKMNDTNLGIVNNNAEIYESYNDLGLLDIDSTPANKVQTEDDMSSADAILGLNTGETIIYITLIVSMITILGVGIYLIRKKVLRRI